MSTVEKQGLWSNISNETLDPKYEKCRNITEEIYKRINITFQIKKLETDAQSEFSDLSDHIDSNELSNETDLFACDKSSLSSSADGEQLARGAAACALYLGVNNNEERKPQHRPPRKRFRKRIKKTQKQQRRQSDGSSDEGQPLSLVAESARPRHADPVKVKSPSPEKKTSTKRHETQPTLKLKPDTKKPDAQNPLKPKSNTMKVETQNPLKSKPDTKKPDTQNALKQKPEIEKPLKPIPVTKTEIHVSGAMLPTIPIVPIDFSRGFQAIERDSESNEEYKGTKCSLCSLPFRSERGLRRHMSVTHQTEPIGEKKRAEQRGRLA